MSNRLNVDGMEATNALGALVAAAGGELTISVDELENIHLARVGREKRVTAEYNTGGTMTFRLEDS